MAISRLSPLPFIGLEFGLPNAVEVAILIHGYGLARAGADLSLCLALVRKVDADTAILILYIDERDVMILGHGMGHCAHLYLDTTIVESSHYGEMLLHTGVNSIYGKLLHFLAAAHHGNL
jgi:hypothetical protein